MKDQGTHWICQCGARLRMEREECPKCGRLKNFAVGGAFVDGPAQGQDDDVDDMNPFQSEPFGSER